MNERITRLREQSLEAKPSISLERAILLTEFYQREDTAALPTPVARALAFRYILEHKRICVLPDELIVGERGPAPKSTPTYPEICTHSLEDFDILHNREKISFDVDAETRRFQQEKIIPFWHDRSIRTRIFDEVDQDWIMAYEAGVFTEFMEQRAPGHAVLDNKIYHKGLLDFKADIETVLKKLEGSIESTAHSQRAQLQAMTITADAIILFAERHAELAEQLSEREQDLHRKQELLEIARVCRRVPAHAPESLHEALQYYWFVHLGIITELNTWDSYSPGRLDQHLFPFYQQDLEEGCLTKETARELLQAFWIKFNNHPAPPKVGVTACESSTYTDFCLINLGGVTEDGSDAVNELTYLLLDVIEELRLLQPSSMVQISTQSPDRFLHRALKIIKTGYGQPSVFNTEAIIQELERQDRSIQDARNGGAQGCVEVSAFGKESCILTGYFNLPKILEITLNNGTDPSSGKQIGMKTGDPVGFETFEALFQAYTRQFQHFIDIKVKGNIVVEKLYAQYLPVPFMSIMVDDCIAKGKDYNEGGARYNSSYIQGVGLGTITDSLSAIKYHVYDQKTVALKELLQALRSNFDGTEDLRQRLWSTTPKYGNDDDHADDLAKQVFETFYQAVEGQPNTKGGHFRINLLPTTSHIYFGSVLGATPDGRKAQQPLSEGISPVQGVDLKGPTAVLKSAAKIDHVRTGGTLLNQKFLPQILESEEGLVKLGHLVRAYFRMNGHHIQFNVVTVDTLRDAQKHPEKYRDLIVRVAGYSDYFVDLEPDLQDEIIRRTAHTVG
ncbi:MAG: glycyl radical protein [Fidelibacterota bacterium]|nr:MAG: glycyl radical protein [Candidatus Neomarinimicrobiota bacterium]